MLTLGDKIIAGSFKAGASWEVGDVGISAFGIDEALNKRRYLNGQVISQAQFVEFTAMLKSRVSVYPNLATTEVNWQAEVTNSALGQCGKFVIDDVAGTIRLPKVVNLQGLMDLTHLGETVEAGLPNIEGHSGYTITSTGTTYIDGCFSTDTAAINYNPYSSGTGQQRIKLDASLSNSIYGNSSTVQQEAVQYPYFIQVAEGVETSIDVSREIELNNPFSLLDYKFSEYELSNASWLLSNGQWNSGAVYQSVYDLLLQIYNGTVTKAGVSVKLSTETYADTDFVLNTSDTTFRLPIKVLMAGSKRVAGNGEPMYWNQHVSSSDIRSVILRAGGVGGSNTIVSTSGAATAAAYDINLSTDETKSGIETSANGLYLYFYVGEVVQDANIIAAGQALTDIADLKAHSIVETYVNGTSWYRVYSDGWCEQGGKALITGGTSQVQTQVGLIKAYSSSDYQVLTQSLNTSNTCWDRVISQTTSSFNVLIDYSNPTYTPNHYVYWQACGYIS